MAHDRLSVMIGNYGDAQPAAEMDIRPYEAVVLEAED